MVTRKRPRPRQIGLPGTDDGAINELEKIALELHDIRDERMALTAREVDLTVRGIGVMKQHGKTHYQHNGIGITLATAREKLKIKIKARRPDVEDEAASA